MSRPHWLSGIADYFEAAAPNYKTAMSPAFGPLAASLVESAEIQQHDRVLDLGTGSGLVARAADRFTEFVVSLDIARAMLRGARENSVSHPIQADMHLLPFEEGSFDVILASFTLNSSDPQLALAEISRVLKPDGRFVFQEWDSQDSHSEMVSDTFAHYSVEDPPPALSALRARLETPLPWDELESVDELVSLLEGAGFGKIELICLTPQIKMHNIDEFLRYKLAWPIRQAELAAMPLDVRNLCMSDLHENLEPHTDKKGCLVWQPNIVRIFAFQPHSRR